MKCQVVRPITNSSSVDRSYFYTGSVPRKKLAIPYIAKGLATRLINRVKNTGHFTVIAQGVIVVHRPVTAALFFNPGLHIVFTWNFTDALDFTVDNHSRRAENTVTGDFHSVGHMSNGSIHTRFRDR